MKAILDTNILIRLLVKDDNVLVQDALNVVRNNTCIIYSPILAEVIFVLTSYYEYSRKEILKILDFLEIDNFEVEDLETNKLAIKTFASTNLAYIDSWVYSKSILNSVPLKTFDQKLKKFIDKDSLKD